MKLPLRRSSAHPRGQALVEFALILPLLILLLLLAIDFGRVFFGFVALNNAVRIAADEAAWHPSAWDAVPDVDDALHQALYRQRVIDDMEAINCAAPGGGAWTTADVPVPAFNDVPGTATATGFDFGDHSAVRLTCEFEFLTPLVGLLVGNPMTIAAEAEFPVRGAEIDGIPVGGVVPPPVTCTGSDATVPNLVGQTVDAARATWAVSFSGAFTPASGNDTDLVTGQTTSPVSSPGECIAETATVTVTFATPCTAPQLVGAKASAGAGLYSTAGFTGTYTINRPPSNDYNIGSQSLVGGQDYLCSSSITVYK